jgi:KEOPS complex subunit Pcc1
MFAAEIRITSDDAPSIISALGPEAGRELPRTRTSVRTENGVGIIELTASDASAMRAALNSYLECIKITEDIGKITR